MLALPCSAMRVHADAMQVVAHDVANVSTKGFEPRVARFASVEPLGGVVLDDIQKIGGGVELEREFASMISYQRGYDANAAVVRTADNMMGTLLNMFA